MGGDFVRRMGTQQQQRKEKDHALKKEISAPQKIKDLFQRQHDKKRLTTKISLSKLDYSQTVQSFYFGEHDLYSRTLVFSSVRSNLFASKILSRELTQIKKLWLPAQLY